MLRTTTSGPALEAIVGRAVVSERFRAGLLNGRRDELIRPFGLCPEEMTALMSIRARDLSEFALAIEQLLLSDFARPVVYGPEWFESNLEPTA